MNKKTIVFWGLFISIINAIWGLIVSNNFQMVAGIIVFAICLITLYGYHKNNEL